MFHTVEVSLHFSEFTTEVSVVKLTAKTLSNSFSYLLEADIGNFPVLLFLLDYFVSERTR